MTNTQLLILATILVLIYLAWKYQSNKTLPLKPEDIIERKGKQKETFWDAEDFDLSDNESTNSND